MSSFVCGSACLLTAHVQKWTTGISVKSHSCTRWCRWEVLHQILKYFDNVVPFLQKMKASHATTVKLLQLLSDQQKYEYLQCELAVVIDEPFVKATSNLEGDGALAFKCPPAWYFWSETRNLHLLAFCCPHDH